MMKRILQALALFVLLLSGAHAKESASLGIKGGRDAESGFVGSAAERNVDSYKGSVELSFDENGILVQDAAPRAVQETAPAAGKKETREEKKARKEREKLARKQRTDQYTGWVYIPERNFTITNDDIRIEMKGSNGSFGLYAMNEKGSPVPLIVNYESFSSTFVAVRIGRKIYRLNRENGVKSEARRTPYGAQMAYTIPKQAQIVVDFSFLPSIATSSRVDMVRVTIYTINLGKDTQSFATKAVFDTVLGENSFTHFSTAARSRIDTEMQFLTMADEKWIRSESEKAAVQFLLDGKGITRPQYVTLSSKDALSGALWVPQVQDNKSFNSVVSYNNSALGLNWRTAYLDPLKTDVLTFYISVATDGEEPAGHGFLASLEAGKTALAAKLPPLVRTTDVPARPDTVPESALFTAYRENLPVISEDREDFESGPLARKGMTGYGPYDPSSELPGHEYIQNLLDTIAALKNDDDAIDQAEIDRLNAELDQILVRLQQ